MVGDTLVSWDVLAHNPLPTAFATLDLRNNHPVLDFDANGNEVAAFEAIMPTHYANGSLVVRLIWMATSAVSGVVMWQVLLERQDPSKDLDDLVWTRGLNQLATAPSVSGAPAYTNLDLGAAAMLPGEHFRIQVARIAGDAQDTMAGDAELLGVELREA